MEEKTIIYISGDGHSGSTLLDIILGSAKNAISTGELVFLPQKGIKNKEFCACGRPVPECDVWTKIIDKWQEKRILNLEKYIQIQNKLLSNKNILSSYKLLKNPSGIILDFIKDTQHLYEIIFNVTETNIVIDSSKAPAKLLILKNLDFEVKTIHLTRRFGDLLNSNKKKAKKNLKAGIEHDILPRKTSFVLGNWIIKNLLTVLFAQNTQYIKIRYEDIVTDPLKYITQIYPEDLEFYETLKQRGPFYPKHLVAGNAIRMKDHLYIAEKPMNTSYSRLNRSDKLVARFIDFFY